MKLKDAGIDRMKMFGAMGTIMNMANDNPAEYGKIANVRVGDVYATLLKQQVWGEITRKYKEQNK